MSSNRIAASPADRQQVVNRYRRVTSDARSRSPLTRRGERPARLETGRVANPSYGQPGRRQEVMVLEQRDSGCPIRCHRLLPHAPIWSRLLLRCRRLRRRDILHHRNG